MHVHFRQEVSGSDGVRDGQFASCWKNLAECKPHSLSSGALYPRTTRIQKKLSRAHPTAWDGITQMWPAYEPVATSLQE